MRPLYAVCPTSTVNAMKVGLVHVKGAVLLERSESRRSRWGLGELLCCDLDTGGRPYGWCDVGCLWGAECLPAHVCGRKSATAGHIRRLLLESVARDASEAEARRLQRGRGAARSWFPTGGA